MKDRIFVFYVTGLNEKTGLVEGMERGGGGR